MWRGWAKRQARMLADLQAAGFSAQELADVRNTPAMWQQLRRFYAQGGRVLAVRAAYAAANGQPAAITFFCPDDGAPCTHSTYETLAHELGHALFCPEQWREPASFASAEDYARSREMGEAHAWLNQYTLCLARHGMAPSCTLAIENTHDFGVQLCDVLAEIGQMRQAGHSDAAILAHLAQRNAHMFPCGMGDNNFKTYGQYNRWRWLAASGNARLQAFLAALGRPLTANEQKLLVKLQVLDGTGTPSAALLQLAQQLQPLPADASLQQLYRCGTSCMPQQPE